MVGRELASCTQHARLELQLLLSSDCLEREAHRGLWRPRRSGRVLLAIKIKSGSCLNEARKSQHSMEPFEAWVDTT